MSMYKTIFWSDEYADYTDGQSVQLTNGEALVYGESAFSNLNEAVAAAGSQNAIVIKVASGKYDSFAVVSGGNVNSDVTVTAVDFGGGEVMIGGENVTVAASGIDAAGQAEVINSLNSVNAGNGKVFVAAADAPAGAETLYVSSGEASYIAAQDASVIYANDAAGAITVAESINKTIYVGNYTAADAGFGTTHFADIQSAVAAASEITGSTTTIELAEGSYNDDVDITLDKVSQKGDIVFKAAAGADVTIGGKVTIGYYERGVGAAAWGAGVTFENITFDQTADATHSLDVQAVTSFIMNNCRVIGDGEYGITSSAGNNTGHAEINNTVFTNAAIQSLGNFSSNLTIDGCTFNDSRLNVQGGGAPGLQIINTTFNGTVTDEHVGDSFYFIRSNDCPIFIQDCTANVDSAVTGIATDQKKWGLLWQRQAGGTQWEVTGLVVNYTDAALAQTELLLNKNGTTNTANEVGRITFIDLSSDDNDIADLLAKTEGAAMVEIDGKTYIYDDGSKLTFPTLYVDPSYTAANPGTGNIFGYNSFNSFTEALKAVGPNTEKIELSGNITEDATAENIKVELTKDLTISGGNVNWNAGRGWLWFAKADGVESANLKFENTTISGADKNTKVFYFGEDVTTTIGSGASVAIYNGAAMAGSVVKVAEGGELISLKEAFQVQASGDLKATLIVEGASDFVAADATMDDRQVYFKYTNVDGNVDVTNGYFAAYDYVNVRNNGSFTADNSLIQIGANEAGVWSGNPVPNGLGQLKVSGEGSELNITNNSILEVSGNVTNNGTINIEDSTFIANGTIVSDGVIQEAYNRGAVTNNGTFTVGGESTVNIANMTGSNIQTADGAIIKDSTIGGGGITATGDLTLKGENKFGSFSMGYFGHDVTIGADASLETTGTGRLTLAYANTLDVDGSITDAKTADKATTKKSLNIKGGVSITGSASYGEANNGATFDVDNAYISLGSTTSKNSAATGDFVLDFNNSIVEFTKDFQIAASTPDSGLTPTYQLNVKDSVMTVADRFAFNHENGTAVIDNSTLDITNQFKNVGSFTLQNGSEMNVGGNADGPSYEKTGNFGTLNIKSGSTFAMADAAATAAYPFYNAGTVNVDGATFSAANVKNTETGSFNVTGTSTLKIANLSGNADITDAELQDGSYITNGDGTVYFNGANAIEGAVTIGSQIYNYGKLDVKDGATFTNQSGEFTYLVGTGASLNVAENATVMVNDLWNNVQGSAVSTIDGTVEISHNAWLRNATINGSLSVDNQLCVYSNDAFNVNGELTINGNGSPAGWLIGNPGSSTGAYAGNITVNVTGGTVNVTGTSTGEEIIIQQFGILNINTDAQGNAGTVSVNGIITNKGDVNITDGSMASNYIITNSGTMNVTDGVISAGSIANSGTINLSVTAEKLGTITDSAYTIINQTGSGAALNETVNYNGTEYAIGDRIDLGDIAYTVTNGDGNDIAIEAVAKILTVNSSYTEATPGFGFNKFNKFEDALQAASSEVTAIKLESDVTVDSEIGYYNLPADLSIIADEHVTLDMAGTSFYPMNKKTLVVGENVEITNMGQMIAYESQVILNGDFAGSHLWTFGWNGDAENGATGLTINETSKVTVSEQLEFRGGDITVNGNITDTAAALGNADQIQLRGTTYGSWGGERGYATKVNLNDTYIKLAQNTIGGANTKFQDGSSAIVTMDNSIYETASEGVFNVASTGLVNAENGSIIYINSGVRASNAGTINITDSTFVSNSTFTNSGEIKVSGDSTINVAQMANDSEAIQILDGATITESSVNGAVDLTTGTINFAGTNAFTGGMLSAGYYNYGGDLTVNITGDFTASNMVAWGGNEGKTIVNIGSEDARTTYNGGTIGSFYGDTSVNITNTDVEYHYMYIQGNLNVSDSTLQIVDNGVNTYFRTASADHRIAIDNTTWNAGSFTNMGSYDASIASGSAIVDITGGSTFNSGNFTLTSTEGTSHTVALTVNDSTVNASTALKVGAGTSATFENGAALNAATIVNNGTFTANDSTVTAGTFQQYSATGAVFNDVDMDVTNFVNGADGTDAFAVIGGNSKVQIDNLSGYYALRLADGTTLKGGTNIVGSTSVRAQGDVTFGETATDVVHIDSFDNNNAAGNTMTVNGTLDISSTGKGFSTYWLGINGNADTTTLTGAGTINSNTATILQYGKILVDKDLTINVTDQYAADLRFTLTDITIKGEINSIGNNNKLNAIQTSTVTLTGENAALNLDGYLLVGYQTYKGNNDTTDMYKSTVTVEGGAALNVDSTLYINKDSSILVDADSTFSAGSIFNDGGMINSTNAGEIVIDRTMTIAGTVSTDTLTINNDAAFTVGTISVNNLNLAIGSSLTLTGANSSVTGTVTVTGDLVPANAEFTLVTSNWNSAFGGGKIMYKGSEYTVKEDVTGLTGLNFVVVDGNLYVKEFGAAPTSLYIGEFPAVTDPAITDTDNSGTISNGDKFTFNGLTYTIGENAFATMDEALASDTFTNTDGTANQAALDSVTAVSLGSGDHVSDIAENFNNVTTIEVLENAEVVDTAASEFDNDLVINNYGHLEADITTVGTIDFVNTSSETLLGSYSAEAINGTNTGAMAGSYTANDEIIIDNTNGTIGGTTGHTDFDAATVAITGGDASDVSVKAGALELTDTNTFGLNADSDILSGSNNIWNPAAGGNILLNGSANISIDGDNAAIGATIEAVDHTGTVTFNGEQTYTGDMAANKFVVAETSDVTVDSVQFDFNELTIAGTLNTDFTSQNTATDGGAITGTGILNTTHSGNWIINDSVSRDFSGFTGSVNMSEADAGIVMGKGNATAADAADVTRSYFANGTTVTAAAGQNIFLAGNGVTTGINFAGAGSINVGAFDGALADVSTGFTQTFTGANDSFTGTVNVSEEGTLTLQSNIGGAIDLDAKADTGNATTLVLDAADLALTATVKGDANDIIDVNQNASLETAGALNSFAGTVDIDDNKLTINGANTTDAIFKSSSTDARLTINADQIFNATGAIDQLENRISLGDNDLTLNGVNTFSSIITGTTASNLNLNADLTLDRSGMALYQYAGTVNVNDNTLTITGTENTAAKFTSSSTDADINWYAGIMSANGALDAFNGNITVGNELTLKGSNNTDATFTSDATININAANTFNADGAIDNVTGTINLWGNSLTLNGVNSTSAEIKGYTAAQLNVNANTTLKADNVNFDGTLNINTANTIVQLDGDFGTANGNSVIAFNANNTELRIWDEKTVVVNSTLDSDSVTGELIYNWYSDLTLAADGALDNYDGEIKIAASAAYPGKVTLKGDNVTDAFFTTVNYTLNAEIALDGGNLTLTNSEALEDYTGKVNVGKDTLTIDASGESWTTALFHGDAEAVININSNTRLFGTTSGQVAASHYSGNDAITNFNGTINIADGKELALQGNNTTNATVTGTAGSKLTIANASSNGVAVTNTFNSEDAISNFAGTIALGKNKLVLNADNTTAATITGNSSSTITAGPASKQEFTGNTSSFRGLFDIASGAEVELSGTIADTINAQGDTLTLSNATGKDVTVNAGTGSDLDNLAFGANNITLGAGDGDDFTNVTGSGNIVDFGQDQTFGTVTAAAINVTGSQDQLSIDTLTANVNITVDAAQAAGALADVTVNTAFTGDINVSVNDGSYVEGGYKLATYAGFNTDSTITLSVAGSTGETVKVDELVLIDGKAYLLQLKDNTLVLTKMHGYSNYVAVDGDWSGKVPYQAVTDGTSERIIGYDAAASLDKAVEYIKGYDTGINANAGTNPGDATIELTAGSYKLTTGTLMTDTNGVTQLVLKGRNGESVTVSGTLRGSDGSEATELVLENVRTTGYVFAGGDLTINNSASVRNSGNAIAAGIANESSAAALTMANDSKLTINGGYFTTNVLTGGSVAFGGDVTVTGSTSVVIDNQSGEALTITGNIFGGSYAALGNVTQSGDAYVTINVEEATKLRGNIYVSGFQSAQGTLAMSGNSYITFSGDASKLTFTGTVSAIQSAKDEIATFDNFDGKFNGTLSGFDSVVISGSTSLELGRRQTLTANTDMIFNVNSATGSDAMYIVRDADAWEFAKSISVTTDANAAAGTYTIVDNYTGGFEGFTFKLNGADYTLGNAVDGKVITVSDDQLILTVAGANTNLVGNTTEQIVIDSSAAGKETQIIGNVVDNATTNASAAVKITTDDAVINNTGTITGAETQKSVAIEIKSGTTDAVVDNSGTITAADVAKYNRAIYSEGRDLAVSNSGTINGEIYQNAYGAQSLDVENSGTITAMTSDMGSNSVISSSNGIINLTGDGGTYELAANTETGKFNGEIVDGQDGIAISASNTTFKAGTDITVGNGTVKGLFNDSNGNIEISGNGNTIDIIGRRSSIGIEEFSYENSNGEGSHVIISGNNNTIAATSVSTAQGIVARNGNIIISGSGVEVSATSTNSYAVALETKDVKNYSGNIIIGEFNADGSVAQASDANITANGKVTEENIAVSAKKGTVQIALAANGKIESNNAAIVAESIQLINNGVVTGNITATGTAANDSITMDVDAILNGSVTGVESFDITGISGLTTDTNGVKAIAGSVDDILANATIEGQSKGADGLFQLAGLDNTIGTADDIWAGLAQDASGDTIVAWGTTKTFVSDSLTAFNDLNVGDTYTLVADTSDITADANKKSNTHGTLA